MTIPMPLASQCGQITFSETMHYTICLLHPTDDNEATKHGYAMFTQHADSKFFAQHVLPK